MIKPSSGTVEINNYETNNNQLSNLGLVFQKPILFPWYSVIDNILFPLVLLGQKRGGRERAMELIELSGIKGFEEKWPHELSGGMLLRASICRALQRIWEEKKITIIFVTHNIEEAVTLGDRVLVLSARPGSLVWEEKINLPRPRNRKSIAAIEFQNHCSVIYEKLGL